MIQIKQLYVKDMTKHTHTYTHTHTHTHTVCVCVFVYDLFFKWWTPAIFINGNTGFDNGF